MLRHAQYPADDHVKQSPQRETENRTRKQLDKLRFFFGITKNFKQELQDIEDREICGLKLFMGSTTGGMLVDDNDTLTRLFEQAKLPVMVHCEDPGIIARNMAQLCARLGTDDPAVRFHPAIRSEEACYASTARAVELARHYGTQLHVAHVSTARELELFTPDAPNITAEACVPHLVFSEADYDRLGSRIKCNPAIKTAADRDALRHALTDGRITCIATDHAPHTIAEKTGGAAKAMSGMPMVQFSLPAMLDLVSEGVMSLERLVELMCHAPARLFRIGGRGFLREGYKADLVLVRPDAPWTLTPNRIESRCNWSPMEGHTFKWRVEKTFCNGTLVYSNGHINADYHPGQQVCFDR